MDVQMDCGTVASAAIPATQWQDRQGGSMLSALTPVGPVTTDPQVSLAEHVMNERITENLVRDELRSLGYYAEDNGITIEEQKSENVLIKRLLKTAGKGGKGGKGSPEFIIQSKAATDFLLIVECKASTKDHASAGGDQPAKYAVDGALHYATYLSREYNVIAVAVSGQKKGHLRIATYLHARESLAPKMLTNKAGVPITNILAFDDYLSHAMFDPEVERMRYDDLMAFSRELHNLMRDHARLTESEKPLLVSGTLIALKNNAFSKNFPHYTVAELPDEWFSAIKKEIDSAEIPNSKKNNMVQPYSSIQVHPELSKSSDKYPKGTLYELVRQINERAWPFMSVYQNFDVIGQFYGEFLKYTGGDKKALGIVLTPRHITELFAKLAGLSVKSTVVDPCCGTAGFLVTAMHEMLRQAASEEDRTRIKNHGLIGVEQQPNMYALAASNMILRGDGKANLYQGSCFEPAIIEAIKKHKADVGMINPPYSQGDADLHELVFVKNMLDCLVDGGTGIAIVPISSAIAPHPAKREILDAHTLEAVMSMPVDLFAPVGTVTCIMVFTAHKAHQTQNKKTWFGYWKDDGFVKTKHLGRVDLDLRWPAIRDAWVTAFLNRDEIPGLSVKQQVGEDEEWCAEAYMETDYRTILVEDFERELKKFLVFKLMSGESGSEADEKAE